jgi:chitin disaccharide deacetylase
MTTAQPVSYGRAGVTFNAYVPLPTCVEGSRDGFPVIVHADDFGETVEITDGILMCIEAGVITSTSIMANMPATAYALPFARVLRDRASFGVHLNFCEGRPLTAGTTLVGKDGEFHAKRAMFIRAMTGKLSLRELEAEIAAQLARVRDAGVSISHVDGHKHLHQLPVVSAAVANVLPRFGIERVRITRLRRLRASAKPSTFVRELLAWHGGRVFKRRSLRSPVRTVDLKGIVDDHVLHRRTKSIVDSSGAVELCCHPGVSAADVGKPGSHRRSAELDYLLSPRFRELLTVNGARLVSYWQV